MPVGELQEGLHLRQGLSVNIADFTHVLAPSGTIADNLAIHIVGM